MRKIVATLFPVRQFIGDCTQPAVLAAALLLLGAAARLRQYLAVTSYWHDEAYLLLNVFPKSFLELAGPLSHDQAAPPLFLWILRACYLTLGPTELAMRLPALLSSLLALALMVPLARAIVGGRAWLFAVGCAALSSSLLHLTYQVKPYTTDVLIAESILLAVFGCLNDDASSSRRRIARLALFVASFVGPWLSFPSVFVSGAACVILVCHALGNGGRRAWFPAALGVTLAGSCLALWLTAARYHNTNYQQTFWAADFVDVSSPFATVNWLGRKLIEAGDYGMHGTGIPMAVLAALGLAECWRRQPWLATALVLPAALACVAAAAKHYPLGNRLLAFLLPCLWLLAAQGAELLISRFQRRAAWVALVPALLLLPGTVYTARYAIFAKPSVEFRQAFAYIHEHLDEGDSLWVSQPEVHEVYFGRDKLLDANSSLDALTEAAQQGRVWMLCHPPSAATHRAQPARRQLQACGARKVTTFDFVHLDVTLYSSAD